jgi:3-hydroxyacyl-CoA dehydrogenase
LVKVADNAYNDCVNDESRDLFKIPTYVQKMVENKWLGDKTGQGFYKKLRDGGGKKKITLNLNTLEYEDQPRAKFATIEAAKQSDDLKERLKILSKGTDKAGEFIREVNYRLSAYASNRVPEIADEIYRVDDALRAGFGWELGPFQAWDVLGVAKTVEKMKAAGHQPAAWV